MAAPMKIVDVAEVKRWYDEGYTYPEMAEMHLAKHNIQVSASSFSALRRRMGWEGRLLIENPLVPWKVLPKHKKSYLLAMLQRESRRRVGLPITESFTPERVEAWAESLRERNAVVDYRPTTEKGFYLTYARPGIDLDIIRDPGV